MPVFVRNLSLRASAHTGAAIRFPCTRTSIRAFTGAPGRPYLSSLQLQDHVPHYLTYGNFISAVINFLILAVVVFFIVRFVNKINEAATRKEREEAEAAAAEAAQEAPAAETAEEAEPIPSEED